MRGIVVTVHDPDLRRLRQIGMRSIAASKNIEASREAEMNRNISAIVKKAASVKNAIILMVLIIVTGCLSGCGGDSSADRKVDVDLTDMSATMVYSEVFDMVNKPDEYIGKTIKVWYEVLGQKYSITGKLTNVTKGLAIICTSTKEDEHFSINDVVPINLIDIVNLFATFDEKEVNTK